MGSTCDKLKNRLLWHVTNKNSQVYKNKHYKPVIELLVRAPIASKKKKTLEQVENKWIQSYAKEYGDKVINIRVNTEKKKKEIEFKVEMETDKQLQDTCRLEKLGKSLRIKDDVANKLLYYDGVVDGKRYKTKARYNNCEKEKEMAK